MPTTCAFDAQRARAIEIGIEVQRQHSQDVIAINAAVEAGTRLQSWAAALGDPDSQQFKSGVVRFGNRWYLTNEPNSRDALHTGCSALSRLQLAIQSRCNAEGIDIAFTNSGPRIRIPNPNNLQHDGHPTPFHGAAPIYT